MAGVSRARMQVGSGVGRRGGFVRDDNLSPLISSQKLAERVAELGTQISADLARNEVQELVVVGLLKGSFIFMADLVRHLNVSQQIEFVRASSYGGQTTSSGKVIMSVGTPMHLRDQHVLIVEDVLDTGLTLTRTLSTVRAQRPASVQTVALLAKSSAPEKARELVDYVGFEIGEEYVVGYGLDHAERYRELPELWALKVN